MINSFTGEFAFLSNFYWHPMRVDINKGASILCDTLEHAYQAAKTSDMTARLHIADCTTPGRAKRLGQKVELIPNWDIVRIHVMHQLLQQKFQDVSLGLNLTDTYPHHLSEGNKWGDTFWGQVDGVGLNVLGILLMLVRSELETL